MAARYWVGGTTTWNSTATTKWAASSGGAGGATAPTAADDVFFDGNSGASTVTLASGAVARSVDCTGFTGTISHPAGFTLSVGDATAGAGNNAFKTVAGMTYTVSNATTSVLSFISTAATTQTLTTGGKTWPTYTINGAGSSYQLADGNTVGTTSTVTLTAGTFDTNGQTCSWGLFVSNGTATRTLTLGASAISISGTTWNTSTITGLTFNPGTSSITQTAGNATFQSGGLTYNNVTLNGNSGTLAYSGASTFANLTIGGFTSGRVTLADDVTVTGTYTMASSSATNMSQLQSAVRGVQRTITAAAVSLTNHNLQDINAAGASAPWTTTSNLGDMGGNSNITFTTPVTRYWVATAGGNYNATTSWSASSGGASGASIPLPQDTVVFDANSITAVAKTITINVQCTPTLDFTNLLNTPTVSAVVTNGNIYVRGNLLFSSAVTPAGTTRYVMASRNPSVVSTGTTTLTSTDFLIEVPGTTVSLSGNFATSGTITLNYGTIDANGFNVTCTSLTASNTNTRGVTMGSGTWTLTGTSGNVWNTGTLTGLTLNPGTSTVAVTDTGASSKTFVGGTNAFYNLTVTAGGAGAFIFSGTGMSWNLFTCTGGPKTISFGLGTFNFAAWNVNGTLGNLITVNSSTPGSARTLNFTGVGIITGCDYLSIQDLAPVQTNTWFAGRNSTLVSNTGNWLLANGFLSSPVATLSSTGSLVRQNVRSLSGTLGLSGTLLRVLGRALVANLSGTGNYLYSVGKLLVATISLTGVTNNSSLYPLTGTLSSSGAILARRGVALNAVVSVTGSLSRLPQKILAGAVSAAGLVSRFVSRPVTASLSSSGSFTKTKLYFKSLTAVASLTGSFRPILGKALTAVLNIVGSVTESIVYGPTKHPTMWRNADTKKPTSWCPWRN